MDSSANRRFMRTRILYTSGNGQFVETGWDKPEPTWNELEVKAVLTGVCRSDIDMMTGGFGPLPIEMSGHEGVGQVTKVGDNLLGIVKVGDFVATRGEPAYADYYNVKPNEWVLIPSAEPKYILEPVACGINLINQAKELIETRQDLNSRMLILGSGFLAWVAFHTMRLNGFIMDIDVVGNSNKNVWGEKLKAQPTGQYDIIIDLSNRLDVFDGDILQNNALVIMGTQKSITTDFSKLLWKSCTMTFPSPRNSKFIDCMHFAKHWIENGYLEVDSFWTQCYNRNTEWEQAFADGVNRPSGYSRGYIKWD